MDFSRLLFEKEKLIAGGAIHTPKPTKRYPKTFFDPENYGSYKEIFSNVVIVDAHSHLGRDRDGYVINERNFVKQMRFAHVNKAIVFPLNEQSTHNFSKPNDSVYNFYKKYPENIIPFFRLNPKSNWRKEYEKRVLQGFRGIKLHPRSQDFGINFPEAMKIYDKAEKNGLPVLIHAGFGLTEVADDIKSIAETFPRLRLIIGHSAFVDMEKTISKMAKNENVLFDTSTLKIIDLFTLMNSIDYSMIAFGSDVPYYDFDLALEMLVDTAIICNKNPNHIQAILGGNILKWFK